MLGLFVICFYSIGACLSMLCFLYGLVSSLESKFSNGALTPSSLSVSIFNFGFWISLMLKIFSSKYFESWVSYAAIFNNPSAGAICSGLCIS